MNNQDIKIARKRYEKYIKEKEELLLLKREFEELKKSEDVKRYLELQSVVSKKVLDDSSIIRYSFNNQVTSHEPTDEKIYIYMGAYKYDSTYDSRSDIKIDESDFEYADYLLYTNIDSEYDCFSIKPKLRKDFESKYTVLKFNTTRNITSKYYKLQEYYFKQLLSMDMRKKGKILTLLQEKINMI